MSTAIIEGVRTGKLRTLPSWVFQLLWLPSERVAAFGSERAEPHATLERIRPFGLAHEAAYLGYALPEREAVWWGCMCVGSAPPAGMPMAQRRALALAEDWVRRPESGRRDEARAAAKAAGAATAPALVVRGLASARLFEPDSIGTGRMIDGAIRRAAASDQAERTQARLRRFIASAYEIAGGGAGRLPPEAAG